jgi:hypothetical protein
MFAKWPPLGWFQTQTFGGTYSEGMVILSGLLMGHRIVS